jgi:hypothetical protein
MCFVLRHYQYLVCRAEWWDAHPLGTDIEGRGDGVIEVLSFICLEGLRRATEHLSILVACAPAEIRIYHLQSIRLEHYRYTSLLGDTVESGRRF